MGGISGAFADGIMPALSLDPSGTRLDEDWKEYSIGLAGRPLDSSIGGFCVAAGAADNPQGCRIFISTSATNGSEPGRERNHVERESEGFAKANAKTIISVMSLLFVLSSLVISYLAFVQNRPVSSMDILDTIRAEAKYSKNHDMEAALALFEPDARGPRRRSEASPDMVGDHGDQGAL